VPLAALTAWQSLFDTAHLQRGQRVLIHAGSGGVGHFAVQLAKWKGSYVFATASTKNQDSLRKLGVSRTGYIAMRNRQRLQSQISASKRYRWFRSALGG
jgi:NADPH:quinone reductase-like Zn-dependent oxidoreductase